MLERLDTVSLPSILKKITEELKEKLPENGPMDDLYYVYESLDRYTPRIIFEFSGFVSEKKRYKYAVMLGGVFPDMPLMKMSRHLTAGTKAELIAYFEAADAVQNIMAAIDGLDDAIRFHD